MNFKIGDRIFVRGYIDEIRKDTVIVRNDGGYFGTILSEVTGELPSAQPEKRTEKRTETHACDLIDREAAIDAADRADYTGLAIEDVKKVTDEVVKELKQLPSAQPEPHWIPVSERLPEPRVDVWVNSDIGQIQGYYEEHIGIWYASFGQGRDYLELIVTAWMPLPEPYRAERRTDGSD